MCSRVLVTLLNQLVSIQRRILIYTSPMTEFRVYISVTVMQQYALAYRSRRAVNRTVIGAFIVLKFPLILTFHSNFNIGQ